jgi:hypothetical protein
VREHRIGARPAWVAAKGQFTAADKGKLGSHAPNELLELDGIPASGDTDIRTKLMAKPVQPIDPAIYETETVFNDVQRVMGDQEANFGGTSGATATESSIAEGSRVSGLQSDVDELDDFFTDIGQAAAQILLTEMTEETAKRIAGPGAAWPQADRRQIMEEVDVEVVAGSTGRPNRQLTIANLERVAPFVVQTPGISPTRFGRSLVEAIDDSMDVTEWIDPGMPSITALNGMAQPSTGDPNTDPNAQGPQGGDNAPAPAETDGGIQPPKFAPRPADVPRLTENAGVA